MKKLYLFFLSVLSLFCLPITASEEDSLSLADWHGTPVAFTHGEFSVSPTGAAMYNFPIEVPPGINGMTPSVSLQYNSMSGNGIAGVGINISGLSVITLGAKDIYHDGAAKGLQYDGTDVLYLDGKRLILKSGTVGTDGVTYTPYDNPYVQIVQRGSFNQNSNDNNIYYELSQEGKKITYQSTATFVNAQNRIRTLAWYISKVEDADHNIINYSYNTQSGYPVLTTISYGSNTGTSVQNYISINFTYDNERTDPYKVHIGPATHTASKRLSQISLSQQGVLLRKYSLQYSTTIDSGDTKFSRLIRIVVSDGEYVELNPVVLEWKGLPDNVDATELVGYEDIIKDAPLLADVSDIGNSLYSMIDIDGDGVSELVEMIPGMIGGSSVWVYTLYRATTQNDGQIRYVRNSRMIQPGNAQVLGHTKNLLFSKMDFNGDGIEDMLVPIYDETSSGYIMNFRVYLGSRNFFGESNHAIAGYSKEADGTRACPLYSVSDINADGRSEIVVLEKGMHNNVYTLYAVNYDENAYYPGFYRNLTNHRTWYISLSSAPKNIFTADYNNDGMPDLLVLHDNGYSILLNKGGTEGFSSTADITGTSLTHDGYITQGDFDGDGLVDFVFNHTDSPDWTLAINNGDGTFTIGQSLNLIAYTQSTDRDDDKRCIVIEDFDGDGKSEILIHKAQYSAGRYFNNITYWLHSDGTSLSIKSVDFDPNQTSADYSGSLASGCIDKTGSIGVFAYSNGLTTQSRHAGGRSFRIYRNHNWTEESGLLKRITENDNQSIAISYSTMLDSNVYTHGTSATYPVVDCMMPLPVVSGVTSDNGSVDAITTQYNYRGLKIHRQGFGFMGMERSEVHDVTNNVTVCNSVDQWDSSYYFPVKSSRVTTFADNTSASTTTQTGAYSVGNARFVFPTSETSVDGYGNTTTKTYSYNVNVGKLSSATTTSDGGHNYERVSYDQYQQYAGMYLPTQVTKTKRHGDAGNDYVETEEYTYDNRGHVLSKNTGYGGGSYVQTNYSYDSCGNLLSQSTSAADGSSIPTTSYVYDSTRRFVVRDHSAVHDLSYSYDTWGHVLSRTDSKSSSSPLTTTYTYDSWGYCTQEESPTGVITSYDRWWGHTPSQSYYFHSRANGQPQVTQWYDAKGRPTHMESTGRNLVHLSEKSVYDGMGNKVSSRSVEGNRELTHTYTYNGLGDVLSDVSTAGSTAYYSYSGRTVSSTINGIATTKTSDAWGNVLSASDPSSSVTFSYLSSGKPRCISSGEIPTTFTYDAYGNRTSISDPSFGQVTYTYDAMGKLLSKCDASGRQTTLTYSPTNKLVQKVVDGSTSTYTYGSGGESNLLKEIQLVTDSTTASVSYSHDAFGRVASETRTMGTSSLTTSYSYNNAGQTSSITFPNGVTAVYEYDGNGYPISCNVNNTPAWYSLRYDGYTSVKRLGLNLSQSETTDGEGRLCSRTLYLNDNDSLSFKAQYDQSTGNMVSRTIANGPDYMMGIADDGRLSPGSAGNTETFSYDSSNRLVSHTKNNMPVNVSYDANGNIVGKSDLGIYFYDEDRPYAVSDVTNDAMNVPFYDQIIEYTETGKVKSISDGDFALEIMYGPENMRYLSVMTENSNPIRSIRYGADYEEVTLGSETFCYCYVSDDVVYISRNRGAGNIYFLQRDNLGSVLAIVDYTGNIVFRASYDAWGRQDVMEQQIPFHRGYTGHEMLLELRLINMNGRVYDPMIGRFLSPDDNVQDPLDSQTYNRYSYCRNNPLSYVDPNGENPYLVYAIAALIGGVSNVCANWSRIESFGDALGYFSIGAVAGAGGAVVGAYVGSAVAGVSAAEFTAGTGGFLSGAFSGAAGTAVAMPLQSGGNAIFYGNDFMDWDQYAYAIMGSAVLSGYFNGMAAEMNGDSFWTGAKINPRPYYNTTILSDAIQNYNYEGTSTTLTPYEKGQLGVQKAMEEFTHDGGDNVVTEVSMKLNGVTYRADFVGEKDKIFYIYEVKNGLKAGFTNNQKTTIPLLMEKSSFTPFGKKALDSHLLRTLTLQKLPYTDRYVFVLKRYY